MENEHYTEWVVSNKEDLQTEYMKKNSIVVLDDDLSDYFDDNNDSFNEYVLEQYGLADHEVYY